ncbi:hypothetical protein Neosp_009915 [[Neocosmospora] mangrovei]
MTREERAPLLPEADTRRAWYTRSAELPILVAGFIITLSFSLTQVPILYVFHLMECVTAGGWPGIIIFQCTQLIAIIGGPVGYVLIVNIMVSEVVDPIRRTSVFGKLQGCIMLGQGVGYLAGGMIGDVFGIQRPFEVAFVCFLLATTYAGIALPYIAPEDTVDSQTINRGASGFFSPLKILLPQKIRFRSGQIAYHYGVLFLCCGVFLGVLATDYAPFMIQMYATAEFNFNQAENGWLIHLDFDLFFLRWSLVIDGVLTTIAAFATHRWHIYLAAFLLPLGSGSAPAAKGVITDMCSSSQRADALNAITLVENIARLATQGFFGFLFAFLAGVGKAYLTFFFNAPACQVKILRAFYDL